MFRVTVLALALLSAGCVVRPYLSTPGRSRPGDLARRARRSHRRGEPVAAGDERREAEKRGVDGAEQQPRRAKAIADIDAARAQYGETRSSLFPTVDAELSHTRSRTLASGVATSDEANGAVSSFELDLFGRNQSSPRRA